MSSFSAGPAERPWAWPGTHPNCNFEGRYSSPFVYLLCAGQGAGKATRHKTGLVLSEVVQRGGKRVNLGVRETPAQTPALPHTVVVISCKLPLAVK